MMDSKNEIVEQGEQFDVLDELNKFIFSSFELAKESYEAVVYSSFYERAVDAFDTIDESADKLSKIYKSIKLVASIPDKLFLRKFERLCLGIGNISEEKRKKYIKKITKKKFNKESVFILDVINKAEDLEKIDLFLILWEAKMDEKIDLNKFRRYVIMISNTMLQDILYMKEHVSNDNFYLSSIEEEGLVSQGWIMYAGLGIGTANHPGGNLYEYTSFAKEFCECVFGIMPSDENKNGPLMFTGEAIEEEDITALFTKQ